MPQKKQKPVPKRGRNKARAAAGTFRKQYLPFAAKRDLRSSDSSSSSSAPVIMDYIPDVDPVGPGPHGGDGAAVAHSISPTLVIERSPEPQSPDPNGMALVRYASEVVDRAVSNVESTGQPQMPQQMVCSAIRALIGECLRDNVDPETARNALVLLVRSFRYVSGDLHQGIVAVMGRAFSQRSVSPAYDESSGALTAELRQLVASSTSEAQKSHAAQLQSLYETVCVDGSAAISNLKALMMSTMQSNVLALRSDLSSQVFSQNQAVEGRLNALCGDLERESIAKRAALDRVERNMLLQLDLRANEMLRESHNRERESMKFQDELFGVRINAAVDPLKLRVRDLASNLEAVQRESVKTAGDIDMLSGRLDFLEQSRAITVELTRKVKRDHSKSGSDDKAFGDVLQSLRALEGQITAARDGLQKRLRDAERCHQILRLDHDGLRASHDRQVSEIKPRLDEAEQQMRSMKVQQDAAPGRSEYNDLRNLIVGMQASVESKVAGVSANVDSKFDVLARRVSDLERTPRMDEARTKEIARSTAAELVRSLPATLTEDRVIALLEQRLRDAGDRAASANVVPAARQANAAPAAPAAAAAPVAAAVPATVTATAAAAAPAAPAPRKVKAVAPAFARAVPAPAPVPRAVSEWLVDDDFDDDLDYAGLEASSAGQAEVDEGVEVPRHRARNNGLPEIDWKTIMNPLADDLESQIPLRLTAEVETVVKAYFRARPTFINNISEHVGRYNDAVIKWSTAPTPGLYHIIVSEGFRLRYAWECLSSSLLFNMTSTFNEMLKKNIGKFARQLRTSLSWTEFDGMVHLIFLQGNSEEYEKTLAAKPKKKPAPKSASNSPAKAKSTAKPDSKPKSGNGEDQQ